MAEEASPYFRGYARIELRHFKFRPSCFCSRIYDPSNVKLLEGIFKHDGCAREEPRNFITAVMDDGLLQEILTQSNTSLETLKDETQLPWLTLPEDARVLCLYGKHRVQAANHVLLPGDRWWCVALYSQNLPDNLRRRISMYRDPHFSPGDIFRNWRQCDRMSDVDAAFWQALIPDRSRKDIKRLKDDYHGVMHSLDRLITFPGLWVDFSFAFIRRLLQISCPKETVHYLDRIYRLWSTPFKDCPEFVDVQSIQTIQNLMPRQSTEDRAQIIALMDKGFLFPSIKDATKREALADALSNTKGRILTLHSMIQDTLLWHACAGALKTFVAGKAKDLRHAIMRRFHPSGMDWPIQVSESVVESMSIGRDVCDGREYQSRRSNSAWVQLWCFAIRHVESLSNTKLAANKNSMTEAHAFRSTQRESNHRFALLARKLGFSTPQIDRLCADTTLRPNVKAYLLGRRPRDVFDLPARWEDKVSSKIIEDLMPLPERTDCQVTPPRFTGPTPPPKRCGLPLFKSHQKDRLSLFLPHIFGPDQPEEEFPSTFAVLRDMVFCFLGEDMFPTEFSTSWGVSSPVDFDSHPPGTPTIPINDEFPREEITTVRTQDDQPMLSEEVTSTQYQIELADIPEDSSNIEPQNDLLTSHAVITRPPQAAGFEDAHFNAPLNRKTHISHHRRAEEILGTWFLSRNTTLAVFFFFKTREYIKFRIDDPSFLPDLEEWLSSIANEYFFADINRGLVNWEDVVQNIHQINLLLVYTELEHESPPSSNFWQFVSIFDPHTGKRNAVEDPDVTDDDIPSGRKKRVEKPPSKESDDTLSGRKERVEKSPSEESDDTQL